MLDEGQDKSNIKASAFCYCGFLIISFLIFRTNLPKISTIFLYNLIIILSLQGLGFYRALFFLSGAILLTIMISLSLDFFYAWNAFVFLAVFLIVDEQIKKHNYYSRIIKARIDEVNENTNALVSQYDRHKKEAVSFISKEERYTLLKEVTARLNSTLIMDQIVDDLIGSALNVIGKTENAFLFLVDTKKQELGLAGCRTKRNVDAKKTDLLDEWVFKERQCLIVEDIRKDYRFSEEKIWGNKRAVRSIISAPLIDKRKLIGILRLEHSLPHNYTSEDLRLLDILSDIGAVSLENAKLYSQTLDLAVKDGLTGLYLSRYFLDRLREEILKALHNNTTCSFLMLDIDNFRDYNDRYGHTAGDMVLKAISMVLQRFSDRAIIGRYGGEEFALILPGISKISAGEVAEELRKAVAKESIVLRRINTNVTVSIGVANFPDEAKTEAELILKADERLYMAKRQGKDRVVAI